jgi:hypothetical protein
MRRLIWLALPAILAACGGAGDWAKPGADRATVSREYQECRALAGDTVETQAKIDQDIAVTRQSDLQRSAVVRSDTQLMRDRTRDRAAGIVEDCMKAKGFGPPR